MIDLPKDTCDDVFEGEISRSSVIKTRYEFENGTIKEKFFIALSRSPENNPLVFVVTTSNPEFFDKHPEFNRDIIRITAGSLDYFPLDTIIDCRSVLKIPRDTLKNNFHSNDLKFCGNLPSDLISKIESIIKYSRHIARKDKKLILGKY